MILRTLAAAALALTLIGATHPANAIVTRHDTPDARYLADEHAFPPLADLPGEGHGVLIAPQWVLTVAHAVYDQRDSLDAITIAGQSRAVAEVIVHPEFEPLPADAMSGDAAPLMARLGELRDIALIRLAEPVNDVAPVTLYRGANEAGRLVRIIGRGATANGLTGEAPDTPHRGALRRAYNRIDIAEGRWLAYSFDQGRAAHRREGMQGSG
ncbi:MAG TPA: trypsin-like serine protease, partial [Verrucomicrobiae bacterium]|nr:trypsin-like serine protease [Verrucomicrobiae bacterium]